MMMGAMTRQVARAECGPVLDRIRTILTDAEPGPDGGARALADIAAVLQDAGYAPAAGADDLYQKPLG